MLDLKMCPKCAKTTAYENEVCPYCGNYFEKKSQNSDISPLNNDSLKPIVPSNSARTGVNPNVKNGLMILIWITVVLVFIGFVTTETPEKIGEQSFGIAGSAVGILAGWYVFSSWLIDEANKRHRNQTWAFGYGVIAGWFGLIGGIILVGIYWLALKIVGDRNS